MISLRPLLRRSLLSAFVQRASFSTVDGGAGGGGGDKSGGHGRFHVSGSGFWRGSDVQGRGGDHPRQHGGSQHQHQGGAGGAGGGAARRPFGGGNNSNSNFSGRNNNNNFSNNNRDGGGFQHRERLPLGDIRTTADNMMVITRDSGRPLPLQVRKQMTQVRLISPDGKNEGIVDLRVASQAARHHGGVLVLMTRADGNTPPATGAAGGEDALPVLRIRSAEQIAQLEKEKEEQRKAEANTKKVVVKEIRLTTRTEDHDIGVKAGQLLRFLEKNHPVRIFVRLKNNEMQTGEEHAKESIQKVLDAAKDKFVVHRPMRRMGIHVDTTVTPLALAAAQAEAKK